MNRTNAAVRQQSNHCRSGVRESLAELEAVLAACEKMAKNIQVDARNILEKENGINSAESELLEVDDLSSSTVLRRDTSSSDDVIRCLQKEATAHHGQALESQQRKQLEECESSGKRNMFEMISDEEEVAPGLIQPELAARDRPVFDVSSLDSTTKLSNKSADVNSNFLIERHKDEPQEIRTSSDDSKLSELYLDLEQSSSRSTQPACFKLEGKYFLLPSETKVSAVSTDGLQGLDSQTKISKPPVTQVKSAPNLLSLIAEPPAKNNSTSSTNTNTTTSVAVTTTSVAVTTNSSSEDCKPKSDEGLLSVDVVTPATPANTELANEGSCYSFSELLDAVPNDLPFSQPNQKGVSRRISEPQVGSKKLEDKTEAVDSHTPGVVLRKPYARSQSDVTYKLQETVSRCFMY